MAGRLLLRFDDICPTMNWTIWQEIEQVLSVADVKPLMAIIPDNQDPSFRLTAPRRDFWDQVRRWQSRGWEIGVHGYQHSYVTRCSGMLGLHAASELAGLPLQEQERKITGALAVFRRERLAPKVFVAPGHSFDVTTLSALLKAGLRVVSDGLSIFPYRDGRGILWIPQQMWRFRRVPFGVWTVCLHPNFWGPGAVDRLRRQIDRHRNQISSFAEVIQLYQGRTDNILDGVSAVALTSLLRLKHALRRGAAAGIPIEPIEAS